MPTSPAHTAVVLADGRRLHLHEYGDPAGIPCVYVPGTPASGLGGAVYDRAARAAGVRLLSVDKPGYGSSTFQPGRTLRGFAADIAEVADRLGLDQFGVLGESGGGPHALAVAHAMPQRLTVALVVAGMGPAAELWVLSGMKAENRRLVALARRAPWLLRLPMGLTRRALRDESRRRRMVAQLLEKAGPADARAMREMTAEHDVTAAAVDAMRTSGRGAAQELALLSRPWGFEPADVTCRVEFWHGAQDVNVPPAVAHRLAQLLPDATAHVFPNEGHAIAWSRRAELMAAVVRAAESVPA